MITIDPHGQWPLTVRNFYVVLIMTKLVQLESEGLEYYLLGFDQGGNNLVRGNKEAFITLPISYSKFFILVSNPEYDAIRKFNINMVSMYSGGEGLNKVHLTTDVWGDSDVDKEIYCWWLTVGI